MAEYLGQDLVTLDVRPKRAAYIYRTGSAVQFRVAVEHASSRWGGIQEPIVPVSAGGRVQPYWRQLLDILQPDVVFDVSELSRDATNLVRDQLHRDVLPCAMENSPTFGAHALTVVHTPSDIVASDDTSVGSSAGAGVLPSWDTEQTWSDSGLRIQHPTAPADVGIRQLAGSTLIEATAASCGEVYGAGLFSGFALLWIAERNSLRDALWFWNMRALMPRMVTPARAAIVTPSTATDPTFVDNLHRVLRTPEKWTTPDVVVLSLTVPPRRLRALAKKMRLDVPTDDQLSVHLGNARKDSDPLTAAVNIDPRNYLHGERLEGLRSSTPITITRPRTMLRVASPVAFAASAGGHLRVRISGPSFLNVPRRQVLANMFISNATWRAQSLEVETNPNGIYHFDLLVPTHAEMLHAILQESQINMETSQPGRLATAVLARAGTAEPMATPDACEIIRSLTTPRSRTLAKELASQLSLDDDTNALLLIAERVGSQLAQIHRTVADVSGITTLSKTTVSDVLERLVRSGLSQRGLRVECGTCGLKTFVRLEDVTDTALCPACLARAAYATRGATGEPELFYRLNALLDRASDQGAIPHLYAAHNLQLDPQASILIPGALLARGTQQLGEVDLLGFHGQEFFCGEVKTSATGFVPRELDRAVELASAAKADVVVLSCLQPLDADLEAAASRRAKKAGLRLRIVDPAGNRLVDPAVSS